MRFFQWGRVLFVLVASLCLREVPAQVDYTGHKVVRVNAAQGRALGIVEGLEADVWREDLEEDTADVRVSPAALTLLERAGLDYRVLIEDLQSEIDLERAQLSPWAPRKRDGFFATFRSYGEIVDYLKELCSSHPERASMMAVGETWEGRTIWGIRIANDSIQGPKPGFLFYSCEHAREWITAMTGPYLATHLLEKQAEDDAVKALVDNVEWFIVPVYNVDGYEHTWKEDRLWRKNRLCTFGVDMNRNWQKGWGGPGSDMKPGSAIFRGPGPFSELEVRGMRSFLLEHAGIRAMLNVHSYGEYILWPWGFTPKPSPHEEIYSQVGRAMQQDIFKVRGRTYKAGRIPQALYAASGSSLDWPYGRLGILAFALEVGESDFIVPSSEIVPAGNEVLAAALRLAGSDWVLNRDADGVPDVIDTCPCAYDPEQLDADGDGVGERCGGFKDSGAAFSPCRAAAWADFDVDGDLDLLLVGEGPVALFLNDRGSFTEATPSPFGGAGGGHGVACADYDNDGAPDIFIAGDAGSSRLLRNEALSRPDHVPLFADVTSSALGTARSFGAAAWVDPDSDGHLDLSAAPSEGGAILFRNKGDGTFSRLEPDLAGSDVLVRALAWGDYDGDGDQDLYLGTAGSGKLLQNGGQGEFTDVTAPPLDGAASARAAAWADYDGDEDLDLFVATDSGKHKLFQSDALHPGGAVSFTSVEGGAFATEGDVHGIAWVDVDGDGDLDLYLAGAAASRLLGNDGGAFTEVAGQHSLPGGESGVAWGDHDEDGGLDFVSVKLDGPPALIRNDVPGCHHWLHLKLVGRCSNRSGIGARVRVVTGEVSQVREISGSSGSSSQSSLVATFGLGRAVVVDLLEVRWPSGAVQVLADLGADETLEIEEPCAETAAGENVRVALGSDVEVTFARVTEAGRTWLRSATAGPLPPAGMTFLPELPPLFHEVQTTALFEGNLTICLAYDPSSIRKDRDEGLLELRRYDPALERWQAITQPLFPDIELNKICGATTSLDTLAVLGVPARSDANDSDGDGLLEWLDNCPTVRNVDQANADQDGFGAACDCDDDRRHIWECSCIFFHRGDSNADGQLDLADAIYTLLHLFAGGAPPPCLEAADVENDGGVSLTDAIAILTYLFRGGPPPARPGPPGSPCGSDVDPAGSPASLGCDSYDGC